MKRLMKGMLVLCLCTGLVGCKEVTDESDKKITQEDVIERDKQDDSSNDNFQENISLELIKVQHYDFTNSDIQGIHYWRDTITDVMYLFTEIYKGGGMTVMLDPSSGKPLTYENFKKLYNDKHIEKSSNDE